MKIEGLAFTYTESYEVICGLSEKSLQACEIGLSNSVYSVMVHHEGGVVATHTLKENWPTHVDLRNV